MLNGDDRSPPDAGSRGWALLIEYDGAPFVGWQRQAGGVTVQAILEDAASRLAGGAAVPSAVAGRTDAGVHAEGQVASVALPEPRAGPWTGARLRDALNFHLRPHPVVVRDAAPSRSGWHPRFSAIRRSYRYVLLDRRARPALDRGRVWHVGRPLDHERMARAAGTLLGRHDFTAYRASACQAKSPLRTLDRLDVGRDGDRVVLVAEARSFLHHQVRNMVGTLVAVGAGSWDEGRPARALASADRRNAGPTAPPEGLTLLAVGYPENPFGEG